MKVALEAIREEMTMAELSKKYGTHLKKTIPRIWPCEQKAREGYAR